MALKFLALDDEELALAWLMNALREAEPDCEVRGFQDPEVALEVVGKKEFLPDVAFLDIEMFTISGLEMAKRLRECSPETSIVFVTGFSQYAMEAYTMHARGYILKPITVAKIREELDSLSAPPLRRGARVQVQCFGNFEIFVDGKPLAVERSKSKELLAYLVDRRGARCTVNELTAVLWEDKPGSLSLGSQVRQLISDLTRALAREDASDILVRGRNYVAVVPDALDCDYYRFLKGDVSAVNSYAGEYMSSYSWAEFTTGFLSGQH